MTLNPYLLGTLVVLSAGCSASPGTDVSDGQLRAFSVTCLKQGYAVNTQAHTDCVLRQQQNIKQQQTQLQGSAAPAPSAQPEADVKPKSTTVPAATGKPGR